MKAIKAHYKDGQVILEGAPPVTDETDVLVVFPDESQDIERKGVPFEILKDLVGIVSLGGDAVQDSDDIYD